MILSFVLKLSRNSSELNEWVHDGFQVFVPVSEEQGGQMALLGQLMVGLILPSSLLSASVYCRFDHSDILALYFFSSFYCDKGPIKTAWYLYILNVYSDGVTFFSVVGSNDYKLTTLVNLFFLVESAGHVLNNCVLTIWVVVQRFGTMTLYNFLLLNHNLQSRT